jgi:hypothetical protein
VDTNEVAEAMRKVSQYAREKRLARAKPVFYVHSAAEPQAKFQMLR